MNDKSEYEKTKAQVYDNYKTSGKVSIAPLYLSYMLIKKEPSKGGYDITSGLRMVGILTLPATLALTVISLPLGVMGALGNTGWAAFALPIAALHDKNEVVDKTPATQIQEAASEKRNSILVMHELMPFGSKPDREPELKENSTPNNLTNKSNESIASEEPAAELGRQTMS